MNILIQKGFFLNRKKIEIEENGLKISQRSILGSKDTYVHFDYLGIKHLRTKSGVIWFLFVSLFLAFIAIAVFASDYFGGDVEKGAVGFYLALSVISFLIFVITYKNVFYLVMPDNKSNPVEFLYNKPSKQEFDAFLDIIKTKRNEFLDEKYGTINKMLSYELNYKNLMSLLDNDVIDRKEFNNRIENLNDIYSISKKQIGFQINEG